MPHIKTYTRFNKQGELAWFCLTSANLSKVGVLQRRVALHGVR